MIYGLGVWLPKLMMNKGFSLTKGLWFLLILNHRSLPRHPYRRVCGRPLWVQARRSSSVFLVSFFAIALLSYTNGFVTLSILAALSGAGNCTARTWPTAMYQPTIRSRCGPPVWVLPSAWGASAAFSVR